MKMKGKLKAASLIVILLVCDATVMACEMCKKQQPKITQGITHGAGPQSNLDWVIIAILTVITILTFIFSLKYLLRPGEKNIDHIKQTILSNQ
jgi:phage shock protein PspC (stress-responsive transcriptional regulator)